MALHIRMASRPAIALTFAMCLMIAASALVGAQSSDLSTSSPAEGHAQVISQGMAAPAASRVAWRAVERTIPARRDAVPSDRFADGAGFLIAAEAALFVTDQDTKLKFRLAPGEATFVPQGGNQTWATVNDDEAVALSLELVARDQVNAIEKDSMIDHSRSFALPQGDYDIDLVRGTLALNERTNVASGDYPLYLLVTDGSLEVRTAGDEPETVRLSSGEAAAFSGDIVVRGFSEQSATFVAGVIGPVIGGGGAVPDETVTPESTATEEPEVTETPEPQPTAEPEPTEAAAGVASLTLDIRVCPLGMRPETLNGDACSGLPGGYDLLLVRSDGFALGIGDAPLVAPNTIQWSGLVSSTYELLITQVPTGFDIASLDGYVCCTPNGGFTLVIGPNDQLFGTLYFFQPPVVAAPVAPQSAAQPGGPSGDSDGDGLSDQQETNFYGTSPFFADTDGDGVNDSNEIAFGSNPLDPSSFPQ